MSDPVGELIAEYAAETDLRPNREEARAAVEAAEHAVAAAESRHRRTREAVGMQRAKLRHALERLARLEAV